MAASDDTPMMQQWRDVKRRHRDALVLFRVGDFFELFHGDAEEGAKLLGLTLTNRNNGAANKVPLAGIPAKALDEYLARLVKAGRRVAICDQVEDPAQAKGVVKREVTETVTPGTVLQDGLLPERRNAWVVAVTPDDAGHRGIAALDLSTGELVVRSVASDRLLDEIGRIEPAELLIARPDAESSDVGALPAPAAGGPARTLRDPWVFDLDVSTEELERRYGVTGLDGFGFEAGDEGLIRAAGALVAYVQEIRPTGIDHLLPPRIERAGESMVLDDMTRRNLELVEPLRAGQEGGTLIQVLDDAVTAMGARLLRRWLLHPLTDPEGIWARQRGVEELFERPPLRRRLREALGGVADLERLAGKVGTGRVGPRDLRALGRSLACLPDIRAAADDARADILRTHGADLDTLEDLLVFLDEAMAEDPPAALQDGGVIASGFDAELDDLRQTRDGAVDFIARLQQREREATGIGSLKVGFNKVFGYYLEVTKANLDRVPETWTRKQTLANAERYFTLELKEWEEKVFGAEDRIARLEAELFGRVRDRVGADVGRIQAAAHHVAVLDVLANLADVAERRRYTRPDVHTGFDLEITAGRHPVVETMMPREEFIPNDLRLESGEGAPGFIVVLTGPNMAGKSTILRQVGLIQLMAQVGSFVPADAARLPVSDRVFTRVGASDNLARGQSTFMVEMHETAAILHGATDRSLVLLDEIGRGTSTYDGVSIAWAVTEHLHERIGCKTIFATHYHELTQLGDLLPGVRNLNVSVRESGEDIVFLRRLEEGGADRSYGIQVARLAGAPAEVLARARELLAELEGTHSGGGEGLGRHGAHRPASEPAPDQLSIFSVEPPVVARLRSLHVEELTPLEALNLLADLRREARGETD
jgi:DNA mismatch repair protein MutS